MDVTILNRQRAHRVLVDGLSTFLVRVCKRVPPEGPATMAVCLVSERRMRDLNRCYRGCDTATDVLSFAGDGVRDEEGRSQLGDVVVSVPTAARQARAAGHSLSRELKILTLHGYLHLLGYDHEKDSGKMLRLQGSLIRRLLPRRLAGPKG